jgi:tetratricopeptide (TPR) repeat protein
LRTLGLAYHFDGNNQNAVAALRRSVELRSRGDACDFYLLAAAHQQLGNKEEARKWYDQGVVWARENRHPYLREMAVLRAHAETALGIGKQPAPAPTVPPGGKEKR